MMEFKHCDDYIKDKSQPKCLRKYLLYNRIPAYWQYGHWKESWGIPSLFADYKGKRIRVVMASRFGDVGITKDLNAARGYDLRVPVEHLSNFSDVKTTQQASEE